ncbi:hypothetical protein BGW36DRAFT_463513 [Talaromyces proteolyticus]|uniref:Uncharacterized protein n=1 Tax=Talaromyces proteolyticus TaxID=1131652 RepID=A0AAD4PVT9_9EURO|nr:uncharacterized protein BGW36DRAFT_463513 [Talaromyces proteolyticus]KAH8693877.1 hypothetical protein BGW36DRAFT_463513 [Talaromyces proteolyticus]
MSTAYPEGEVFFVRNSLSHVYYDPTRAEDFYGYFMLEIIVNDLAEHPGMASGTVHQHPHSVQIKQISKSGPLTFTYKWWDRFVIGYGKKGNIRRGRSWNYGGKLEDFREHVVQGGPARVFVWMVPMPTSQEQWVWLHLLMPIRAVYFPVSQQTDEAFPELCTFLQINFYSQGTRPVWRENFGSFLDHPFSRDKGIGFHHDHTLGINVPEVMALLSIPRQLRATDIWSAKLVVIDQVGSGADQMIRVSPWAAIDYVTLVNASHAVQLVWRPLPPPRQSNPFIFNLIKGILAVSLSVVPVIGPALSAAFAIGFSIISDKDNAKRYLESAAWTGDVIDAIIGSGLNLKKYIDPGWSGVTLLPPQAARSHDPSADEPEPELTPPVDLSKVPPHPLLLEGLRALLDHEGRNPLVGKDASLSPHNSSLERAVRTGLMSLIDALKIESVLDQQSEAEVEQVELRKVDTREVEFTEGNKTE